MQNMRKNTIVGVVVLIFVIALGMFFYFKTSKDNGYSVVYLSTGEVYVGKLQVFSDLVLTDSYIFQVVKDSTDPTKNTFQLQSTNEVLWAPKELHIIKDNVVFYGPLLENSKIAETLAQQTK